MYNPTHFSKAEENQILELIEKNPFATVLSFPENEKVFINHLPLILSPDEDKTLLGHMAKRNPQWLHFQRNSSSTIIIHGPHTYITPTWYKSGRDVPTWNYVILHLQGKMELVESFKGQIETLKKLTDFFERPNPNPWEFELPTDLMDDSALTSAIVSFKFKIEKIDAKYKLSQNRSEADRFGVIEGLGQRSDEMSREIQRLMMENEK